jgi:hypothetical protein
LINTIDPKRSSARAQKCYTSNDNLRRRLVVFLDRNGVDR